MSISEQKAELRKAIRQKRRSLTEFESREAAASVAKRLTCLYEIERADTILAYMPMRYELDIQPTVEMLRLQGKRIAYPLCIEGGGLRLLIPKEASGFTIGSYGILEPRTDVSTEISAEELDAIILPAVGLDSMCGRLGQGGGYYDRLLARAHCFTVAVGFDCQLVDRVPADEMDRPVDAVITPTYAYHRTEAI